MRFGCVRFVREYVGCCSRRLAKRRLNLSFDSFPLPVQRFFRTFSVFMDKIKAFFQKKKIDAKFKKLGEGHRLTDGSPAGISPSQSGHGLAGKKLSVSSGSGSGSGKSYVTADAEQAAQAAMKRMQISQQPLQGHSRSSQAIRLEAKRQLEKEKSSHSHPKPLQAPEQPETKEFEAFPALAVSGVYFSCELLGDDLYLTREQMHEAVEEFLTQSFADDPLVSSTIMIHSLNGNAEKRQAGIELLGKYLQNIIQSPQEEKFRRIKKSNKLFQEKIAPLKGTKEFLHAVGFTETFEGDEAFYVLSCGDPSLAEHLALAYECLLNGEPVPLKLFRNPAILEPSSRPLAESTLPPDFFVRTAAELKSEQQERSEELEKMLTLRTKEMRERDELKRVYKYKYTLIRIRFPDDFMLQGTFGSAETLEAVEAFVRQHIVLDWAPFLLRELTGEILLPGPKATKTLAELSLSPAAVLHFELDPNFVKEYNGGGQTLPNHYLKS